MSYNDSAAIEILESVGLTITKRHRESRFSHGERYSVKLNGELLIFGATYGDLRKLARIVKHVQEVERT